MNAHDSHLLTLVARAPHVALMLDLDGTLIPFATSPGEATVDVDTRQLVATLARSPGIHLAVVSGRKRDELDERLGGVADALLVAEHGAWRRDEHGWAQVPLRGADPTPIELALRSVAEPRAGALVERKTWSVSLHYRRVPVPDREAVIVEAFDAMGPWLREHPEYELLEGELVLEVRHRDAHKGSAVAWLRGRVPPGTLFVALGDDRTDEDTFAALGESDLSIVVGHPDRPTRAKARLDDVRAVHSFLRALLRARQAREPSGPIALPRLIPRARSKGASLVVISNRLPDAPASSAGESERARNVGGLVSGLGPALSARNGVWLGWSGGRHADAHDLAIDASSSPVRASFDFRPEWHARFYNGFANRSLWPIFHGFAGRARYDESEWNAYVEVNDVFARQASKLASQAGTVWAHDYHLLLVGAALRRLGHQGPIGLFVHIPFPPIDLFETIPWARELIEGMLAFDLVGFHTRRYASNFVRCAQELAIGAARTERGVRAAGREVRVGVFPLGIDATPFEAPDEASGDEMSELQAALRGRRLVLGVDRLDYSKGIVERLEAFGRMLELFPEWRGRVSMLQVAVPSRADVPEYAEQRKAIETLVGRINGLHGEAHWVPVRYVYRSYGRAQLAALYRAADVGFITPLRDGMNLVAKEYVAAQDPANPGALVLSRFAGAADELAGAVLTNPHDREGMARDLARALDMPLDERVQRHAPMIARVRASTPEVWASELLGALEAAR
ncbi:trehalose-phosphatase [Sandaracinus amylolyticus]|uniref:Alpha,alpha-trehalose-phosphate synthase n=1 Tax=Sandaracinus amylolyticus TaxID=927083 RepID=A0A0F6YGX7_9BACT|nr:trehalose-phosphatase [Sandaracinus amylolyticus]AKF04420.1 Alpha,alpha-trehalose-phosphate synthase [Sandaracinus amylolyticus]